MSSFLLEYGVHTALAINLYQEGNIALGKAAKIAGISLEAFMEKLSALAIPIVDYPPSELDEELANLE